MTFQVRQEKFEGPLELLAELIEKEKIAISDISLARVTDEYLGYVKALGAIDPEELAGFLVIAAQLILVKSRSLLPRLELSEEEEESIGELEARIREYQKMKTYAAGLRALEKRCWRIISREQNAAPPLFYPPPGITPAMLEQALRTLFSTIPKIEKLAEEKIKRIISLEEKIAHIRQFAQHALERGFADLIRGAGEKMEVIVSFLAILELTRQKYIDLSQKSIFGDIMIKKLP